MEDTRKIITLPGMETDQSEKLNNEVPLEVRLKWIIREQGKLLSYIEELEDTLKAKDRKIAEMELISHEDRKAIKKEAYYASLRNKIQDLERKIGQTRRDNEELIQRLAKHNINN
jgi:predicted RNase H-like nuclease (RuvC/YqgF family)